MMQGRPPLTEAEIRGLRDGLEGVLHDLSQSLAPVPHPTCPFDGCLLAHTLEPCPACAAQVMTETCSKCGTVVTSNAPCSVCALTRLTGRRSLIRPVVLADA